MRRIWSGDTYDKHLVVFCDQDEAGFFASRENGKIVARSLGGTFLGSTYDSEPAQIIAWLGAAADRILGRESL